MFQFAASLVKATPPVKPLSSKGEGFLLEAFIIQKPQLPTVKPTALSSRSAVESDLNGVSGSKVSTGDKSYTRYEFIIYPKNIPKLVEDWCKATEEVRSQLTYVPVFNATVPTIAVRTTEAYKPDAKRDKTSCAFLHIPTEKREYYLQQMKPRSISTFRNPEIKRYPCLANLVSFGYTAASNNVYDTIDDANNAYMDNPNILISPYPEGKFTSFTLYPSCSSIGHRASSLDEMAKEFRLQAFFFDPSFEYQFDLHEINERHQKRSPFQYFPLMISLNLSRENCNADPTNTNPQLESVQMNYDRVRLTHYDQSDREKQKITEDSPFAKIPYLIAGSPLEDKNDFTAQMMVYNVNFCQQKPKGAGFFYADAPSAYQLTNDDKTKNFVRAQVSYCVQKSIFSEPEPEPEVGAGDSGVSMVDEGVVTGVKSVTFRDERLVHFSNYSGRIMCSIWESQIDECGIQNEFENLMAVHGISCNLAYQVFTKKTMDLRENNEPSLREQFPSGLIEGGTTTIYWNVIQYIRKFGIPVTAEWVKKSLTKTPGSDDKNFYPPAETVLRPNIVNIKNGDDYGFMNLSEINPNFSKEAFYDPKNKWKFAVLFDYPYNSISREWKNELRNMTPEDGNRVMDNEPLANGKSISLQPKNCKTYIIMAYKYDASWPVQVEKYQKAETTCLMNWRLLRTYFKCLQDFADMYSKKPECEFLLHYHTNLSKEIVPAYPERPFTLLDYTEEAPWGKLVNTFLELSKGKNILTGPFLPHRQFFKDFVKSTSEFLQKDFVKFVEEASLIEEVEVKQQSTNALPTTSTNSSSSSVPSSNVSTPAQKPKLVSPKITAKLPEKAQTAKPGGKRTASEISKDEDSEEKNTTKNPKSKKAKT